MIKSIKDIKQEPKDAKTALNPKFYVVFYDKYVAAVPESWVDTSKHILRLPPKNIPNRKQMVRMKVEANWTSEEAKKILGPFGQ